MLSERMEVGQQQHTHTHTQLCGFRKIPVFVGIKCSPCSFSPTTEEFICTQQTPFQKLCSSRRAQLQNAGSGMRNGLLASWAGAAPTQGKRSRSDGFG